MAAKKAKKKASTAKAVSKKSNSENGKTIVINNNITAPTANSSVNNGSRRKVNWALTLVMSIFFGGIGVDRFIMGHVGLGILKILSWITIIGGIAWYIVDIVLIASKHDFKNIEWV